MGAPEPSPTVSTLIVNYNAGDRLIRCLDALKAQTFRDFEAIVIDNGSADGSLGAARAAHPWARYLEAGANLGFAAGNNRAAAAARGAWLALLNPDAYPRPDWLARLIAASLRYPDVDAFGSMQLNAADPQIVDGAGDVFHILGVPYRGGFGGSAADLPTTDGECFAPCAAAALYRRSAFDALGGFDETFFCYGEDVDLGFRLRLTGGRAVQVADAVALHEGSGVSGRYSDFTVYHGNRNRIWTTYKDMPGTLYWPLLPLRLAADLYLLARSAFAGLGRPYGRAMIDGYGALLRLAPARRAVQRTRRASLGALARAFAWSPLAVTRRAVHLRPLAGGGGRKGGGDGPPRDRPAGEKAAEGG